MHKKPTDTPINGPDGPEGRWEQDVARRTACRL